ncbi:uncharacterized protein LOC108041810 [Drosophila rhopaloa]|uniref:Uncharacterized protein LOC108041810 n=1 Tax=Drosophila rhopaloa TaxID=1041015 RepID=A0A6P4EBA3_DRORH|nr:uncharacterized protein LOC108041810 [Drosophila rhopaloa]
MKFTVITVFVLTLIASENNGDITTRHTNVKCEAFDKLYLEVVTCRLKVLGRGIIAENIHFKILKLPIRNITINFSVYKKLSGYHPFLFNVTFDFCHFLRHPNPLSVFHLFYKALMPYTNLNHTCPINVSSHDFILKDFVLADEMYAKIPFPKGSYMFSIRMATEGVWRGVVNTYFDINVDNNPNIRF